MRDYNNINFIMICFGPSVLKTRSSTAAEIIGSILPASTRGVPLSPRCLVVKSWYTQAEEIQLWLVASKNIFE